MFVFCFVAYSEHLRDVPTMAADDRLTPRRRLEAARA